MAIRINLRDYPGWLDRKADQFPFAASQALNSTAFDLQRDLKALGPKSMDFRKSASAALGIEYDKSTKADLEALVHSSREWLTHQVQSGTNRPRSGITWKGKQYLFIPNPRVARSRSKATGRRRIRTGRGGKLFVINGKGGSPVLMLRFGPDRGDITPLGALVPKAAFADDFDWIGQSQDTIDRVMSKHFAKALAKALRTAR